jgi:transposase-like protein
MKKTRQRYDRAFKISVVAELESGKPNLCGVDAGRFFVRFHITR